MNGSKFLRNHSDDDDDADDDDGTKKSMSHPGQGGDIIDIIWKETRFMMKSIQKEGRQICQHVFWYRFCKVSFDIFMSS